MSVESTETAELGLDQDFASQFFVAPYPPIAVRFGAATHIGRVRPNNEDHYAVIRRVRSQSVLAANFPRETLPHDADEAYLFVVADGMGGAAAGELASRIVLQRAWELARQASSWIMRFRDLSAQQVVERVEAYTLELHQTLREHGEADPKLAGMGTTWTSAYTVGWDAVIAHIGDSRAYHWHAGELRQITRDHTLAQAFIDQGAAPEAVGRVRHILTNSLGASEQPAYPEVHHVPLAAGDKLLLCTDGLTDDVSNEKIAELLGQHGTPQAICDAVIAVALEHGGRDNVTVIVGEFSSAKPASS